MKFQKYIPVAVIFLYIALIFFAPASIINKPKFLIINIVRSPLYLANKVFYNINLIARSRGIIQENLLLRKTVDTLTQQLAQYKDIEIENARLKGLLDFKQKSAYKLVAARIIAKDSSNLSDTILIDKGKSFGIQKDDVLISDAGLVGRISEVSSSLSRAVLIADPDSRVSAMVLRTRQTGMVYGLCSRLCKLKFLPLDADIKIGDEVITSGFSSIYPKGLLIGKVVKVDKESNGLSLFALIEPAVDMTRTEELLCITE